MFTVHNYVIYYFYRSFLKTTSIKNYCKTRFSSVKYFDKLDIQQVVICFIGGHMLLTNYCFNVISVPPRLDYLLLKLLTLLLHYSFCAAYIYKP